MVKKDKSTKLSEAIADLDDIKKRQVLTEIRSVKIQSIIAILTVVGASLSFIIIQQNQIKRLFSSSPKIIISSDEPVIQKKGQIHIYDLKGTAVVNTSLNHIEKKVVLDPGSYRLTLTLEDKIWWEENIVLAMNEDRNIKIPKLLKGNISVFVDNGTPNPLPGQIIDVEISSGGNGFLWIYQRVDSSKLKLLFPRKENIIGNIINQISADKAFQFPEGLSLVAGDTTGEEEYILLVTSVNEEAYASEIIKLIYRNEVEKGEIIHLSKNWGITSFKVMVKNLR